MEEEKSPEAIWAIETHENEWHYFCSKKCAESGTINPSKGDKRVCENCSRPL